MRAACGWTRSSWTKASAAWTRRPLDLALRTLDELKQGGRLVGIISHLEEIKQRIPARLEVLPGPDGSRAAFRIE